MATTVNIKVNAVELPFHVKFNPYNCGCDICAKIYASFTLLRCDHLFTYICIHSTIITSLHHTLQVQTLIFVIYALQLMCCWYQTVCVSAATPEAVNEALRELGYQSFRPGQEDAIMRILSGTHGHTRTLESMHAHAHTVSAHLLKLWKVLVFFQFNVFPFQPLYFLICMRML